VSFEGMPGLGGCRRIDHRLDLCDDVGGEAGEPRMLANYGFVFGKVDAIRLIAGDKALLPLVAASASQARHWIGGQLR
jgi:hypothetical protein